MSKVLFKPYSNYILVRMMEAEDSQAGGIYLPEGSETPYKAVVVAVGPGTLTSEGTLIPTSVPVGAIVHLGRNNSMPVLVGEEELFLIRETDLMGEFIEKDDKGVVTDV